MTFLCFPLLLPSFTRTQVYEESRAEKTLFRRARPNFRQPLGWEQLGELEGDAPLPATPEDAGSRLLSRA